MPAAAVIPAPIAYIKVVAVKKLVVGFLPRTTGPPSGCASGPATVLGIMYREGEGVPKHAQTALRCLQKADPDARQS